MKSYRSSLFPSDTFHFEDTFFILGEDVILSEAVGSVRAGFISHTSLSFLTASHPTLPIESSSSIFETPTYFPNSISTIPIYQAKVLSLPKNTS